MIDRVVNKYPIILIFWCLIIKSELIPDTNMQFSRLKEETKSFKDYIFRIPHSLSPIPKLLNRSAEKLKHLALWLKILLNSS